MNDADNTHCGATMESQAQQFHVHVCTRLKGHPMHDEEMHYCSNCQRHFFESPLVKVEGV